MLKKVIQGRSIIMHPAKALFESIRGVHEGQHIEFKQELPTETREKRKRAETLCAFANAKGGVVVFGVVEVDECAADYLAVPFGNELTNFQTSMADLIVPPIVGLHWKLIPEESDKGKGIVLAEVPESKGVLHCVKKGEDGCVFFMRIGRSSKRIEPKDVATEILRKQAQQPVDDVISWDVEAVIEQELQYAKKEGHIDYVHVCAVPRRRPDALWQDPSEAIEWLEKFGKSKAVLDAMSFSGGSFLGGIKVTTDNGRVMVDDGGWAIHSVTDRGVVSGGREILVNSDWQGQVGMDTERQTIFPQVTGLMHLINTLVLARACYANWGVVSGEIDLKMTVCSSKEVRWYFNDMWSGRELHGNPTQGPVEVDYSVDASVFSDPLAFGKAMKVFFKRVCSAFGVEPSIGSIGIDDQGRISTSKLGIQSNLSASVWSAKGFEVTK